MQASDVQDAPVLQVPQKLAPIWQPKRYKVKRSEIKKEEEAR